MRALSRDQYLLVKAATRALIKNCGGLDSAASMSRVGSSSLSDYCNVEKQDVFIPVDVMLDLQKESGTTSLTEAISALSGGSFTPAGHHPAVPNLTNSAAEIMSETADCIKAVAVALHDGYITPRERNNIISQIQDVIHACTDSLILLSQNDGEHNDENA